MKFFAFGTLTDMRAMQAITGRENLTGKNAVLEGFKLGVQKTENMLPVVRNIIEGTWTKDFEAYAMVPAKEGENKKVFGIVLDLNEQDIEALENFHLKGLGWFKDTNVTIKNDEGQSELVKTFVLGDNQEINFEVDGENYSPSLGGGETFINKYIQVATSEKERLDISKSPSKERF